MASPSDVRTAHTVSFLGEVLRGRRRVLEVGCGRGEVARALGAAGFAVTALDLHLVATEPAANVAYVEHDFLDYRPAGEPFDAIVFTSSLHHIHELDRAVAHTVDLTAPGGLVIADDFDLETPDPATLRWYYDTQELLVAAGLYDHDRIDAGADPVSRWRDAHVHDPPLHTGVVMRAAIAARLALLDVQSAEYLYRYISKGVPQDDRGGAIAAHVQRSEHRRIAEGAIVPVGVRIIASRA